MNGVALTSPRRELAPLLLTASAAVLLTPCVIFSDMSVNTAWALGAAVLIFTLWFISQPAGVIAGILFYLVKSVFVRFAFGLDQVSSTGSKQDILGMAPTIILTVLIVCNLLAGYAQGKSIAPDRPRKLALGLAAISFLSIFLPTNTILIGLGGFQRNILPNLMILFLTASVWSELEFRVRLVKVFLVLGIVSCLYGIGQWLTGIYPWEEAWMMDRFIVHGDTGLLTIGLRGIEFRIYSIFFSYMDFFFTNVAIFGLVLAFRNDLTGGWKLLRVGYFILWGVMLMLSVERMPMLMTLVVAVVVGYLRKPKARRRVLLRRYLVFGTGLYLMLFATAPLLKATGAETLSRLSEMANPFAASSILDRSNSNWGPTLEIIASHPWGVGIGYGSQTRASDEAKETDMYVKPHNELLQKVLETGAVGGFIYLLLLISIFRFAIVRKGEDDRLSSLAIAFSAISVAFWLCGLVNIPFSGSSGLIYWGLAGILLAQRDQYRPELSQEMAA